MDPSAPRTIGRYRIYGKIAAGGMATVHFGRLEGAAGFSRTVAIKRLHPHLGEEPEFIATMVDEARLAARIRHPNVVPTLDVVATDGELLVVLEYVRGESLSRLLRSAAAAERRVPLAIASAIAVGALHGLQAAHEAKSDRGTPLGIVHRDVSPQNILVGADGVPRVIDFGVAKAAGRLTTTRDGVVKGKLSYMAPEQLGTGEITRRADVYAMSVVLWEMLTGRRMLSGSTDAELIGKIMAGTREPPTRHAPALPEELNALVMKGLSMDPDDRFASAREMADALMRVVTPAFPTDVGAWVEETAREPLAKRETLLAEIESRSGNGSGKPVAGPELGRPPKAREEHKTRPDAPDALGEMPTVASQASSLSVETPRNAISGGTPRAHRIAGVLAVVTVVAGSALVIIALGTRRAHEAASAPQAVVPEGASVPTVSAQPSDVLVAPTLSALAAKAATMSASTAKAAAPPPAANVTRGRGALRPTPARTAAASAASPTPNASDSIVFTRPD